MVTKTLKQTTTTELLVRGALIVASDAVVEEYARSEYARDEVGNYILPHGDSVVIAAMVSSLIALAATDERVHSDLTGFAMVKCLEKSGAEHQ